MPSLVLSMLAVKAMGRHQVTQCLILPIGQVSL